MAPLSLSCLRARAENRWGVPVGADEHNINTVLFTTAATSYGDILLL